MIVEINNINLLDPLNDGRLVYIKGHIEVSEPLTDPEYGVTISAVKLKRRVQMYQWVELHEETSWWDIGVNEQSSISYITTWKDRLIDSSLFVNSFGHANPKSFPVDSEVSVSDSVQLGVFTLSRELKDLFNSFTLLTSDQRPERRDIKMHSGLYYHSFDVWNPEVGDTRVQLSYAGAADDIVTVLARQVGSTLQPFLTDSNDLTVVLEGEHSLLHLLTSKFPSSGVWMIRIPAYLAAYCAYSNLTFIFSVIAGKRRRMVQSYVNNNKALICHITTASTVFVVMAISWFSYHPVLGFVNLLASFTLIAYSIFKGFTLYCYFNVVE